MQRDDAVRLDAGDDLGGFRDLFPGQTAGIYLDGNSLGRPSRPVLDAITAAAREWATELVGGWERWIDLPREVGDRVGRLLGAGPGQVVVCDSTTVNLYKAVVAAVDHQAGRPVVVARRDEFPTDRYILQGLAARGRVELRWVDRSEDPEAAVEAALDDRTGLVCLSHVDFVTGRRLDAPRLTAAAHRAGALVVWDLAHSAGAVPVDLDGWDADLAVGCGYKYLGGGPGAPGFVYLNARLAGRLRQPIWGWFAQAEQFAMGERYEPAAGAASFLTGTPGIIALEALSAALTVVEGAGVERLWAKSIGLSGLLIERARHRLEPLGAKVVTPADPNRRGAHVAVSHPDAWRWCRALVDGRLVVVDFRPPDVIRLGPAPLYTGYADCFDAVEIMADVLAAGLEGVEAGGQRVT
jgi:kynureninase